MVEKLAQPHFSVISLNTTSIVRVWGDLLSRRMPSFADVGVTRLLKHPSTRRSAASRSGNLRILPILRCTCLPSSSLIGTSLLTPMRPTTELGILFLGKQCTTYGHIQQWYGLGDVVKCCSIRRASTIACLEYPIHHVKRRRL